MNLTAEMEIKAHILVEGLRIEEEALEGVGSKYNEDISSVFGYYYDDFRPGTKIPSDFKLPSGTVAKVTYNPRSPYLVKKEDGTLFLEKDRKIISPIEWTKRPRYYDLLTSDKVEMRKIAQIRGECRFLVCPSTYCIHWKVGDQCRFCNINAAQEARKGDVMTHKKPEQVGEVAASALQEGLDLHIVISGGTLPERKGLDIHIGLLEAIREYTNLKKPSVLINIAAPVDLSQIDRIHKAGAMAVAFNLEVWHPHMFRAICPGKSKTVGRENWLRALEYAVSLFGRGYVESAFILGLEEKENYYQAAEYLAERGVCSLLLPWIPMKGSKLEGHRPPHAEWMLEVNEKAVDIMAKKLPVMLTEDFFKSGRWGCYRCSTISLFWDELRRRLEGLACEEIKHENN